MSSAIAFGLLAAGTNPQDIMVSDKDTTKLSSFREKGIAVGDNLQAASFGEVVLLAVKPNVYKTVLCQLKDILASKLVISIAAGISIDYIKGFIGEDARVIRVMPNTPALVSEGMAAISYKEPVSQQEVNCAVDIFEALGRAEIVDEKLMDAVVSVSGSSPAYVFMMIDAMADGAVKEGLPRDKAITMAAQTVMGAAKMVLQTGKHPAQLKDMVCSPGGTTIDAVKVLEETGFKASIIKAMESCSEKSRKLSGK